MSPFRFAAALVVGLPAFLFRSHFRVHGDSMRPGLRHGDLLHVVPLAWQPGGLRRGAVVVAKSPARDGSLWVKRVIGLPGEIIAVAGDGGVRVNDAPLCEPYCAAAAAGRRDAPPWLCDDREYFLMGDNRADSDDSRRYGPAPLPTIIGRVWFRWPRRRAITMPGETRMPDELQ